MPAHAPARHALVRLVITGCLAILPALGMGAVFAALWGDLGASEAEAARALLDARWPLVVLIGLTTSILAGMLAWWLQGRYARPCLRMADHVELSLAGERGQGIEAEGADEVRALAGQINRLLAAFDAARRDIALRAEQARASVERERNRLATLVAELPQGVLACNRDGLILLYNTHARDLFSAGQGLGMPGAGIGLGRPVEGLFDRRVLAHTRDRIHDRLRAARGDPTVSFLTTNAAGRLLRARVTPLVDPGEGAAVDRISGYLLLADDVTRESEHAARRDRLVDTLTQSQRAGLASIRAAAENLTEIGDLEPGMRARFLRVIRDEALRLSERITVSAQEFADVLQATVALEAMPGIDLVQAAQRRIEARTGLLTKVEALDPEIWLRVDSFALIQALTTLAQRVQDACDAREIRLGLGREGALAVLELSWAGTALSTETAAGWEMEPMALAGESSPRSVREVLARHSGELVYGRHRASARAYFRLLLPGESGRADAAEVRGPEEGRPEFYDFDLFAWGQRGMALDDRPLSDLAYTVFDTETTGLDPSGGDEIIQLGAHRILNGRLLRGEYFLQWVDPRRDIHPASEAIHGISRAQLDGQPLIEQVLPAFHAFARDTVLVAHNAAFDMRFLQLKEAVSGVRFDQPVLDTLLLSAVLHPNQDTHRLDAIAERFGVTVTDRHDALADARVTGQLFLRMVPLLAERGIVTLRQAREASEKTFHARIRY